MQGTKKHLLRDASRLIHFVRLSGLRAFDTLHIGEGDPFTWYRRVTTEIRSVRIECFDEDVQQSSCLRWDSRALMEPHLPTSVHEYPYRAAACFAIQYRLNETVRYQNVTFRQGIQREFG